MVLLGEVFVLDSYIRLGKVKQLRSPLDANADSYAQKSNNGYAHVTNLDLNPVDEAISDCTIEHLFGSFSLWAHPCADIGWLQSRHITQRTRRKPPTDAPSERDDE